MQNEVRLGNFRRRKNGLLASCVVVSLVSACAKNSDDVAPPSALMNETVNTETPVVAPQNQSIDQQLKVLFKQEGVKPLGEFPPPERAKVELGRALFFDKELSGNRDISCATCHHPFLNTGDGLALSFGTGGTGLGPTRIKGVGRQLIPRNSPDVFNRGGAETTTMFWDIRLSGSVAHGFSTPAGLQLPTGLENILAAQAMFPVTSRDEMRGNKDDLGITGQPNELALLADTDFRGIWAALMKRLLAIPEYLVLFDQAYPNTPLDKLGFEHAANAIAAFEIETCTLRNSPWDRYLAGDDTALSAQQKRGALVFYGAAACSRCHSGTLLTDQKAHNIAVPQLGPGKGSGAPLDHGLALETKNLKDSFKFRTPPLRNTALTGPWMHNGAYTTLEAAVKHHLSAEKSLRNYDKYQLDLDIQHTAHLDEKVTASILATLDPLVASPLQISDADFTGLVAFLHALTDADAAAMASQIPKWVPSGLPVAD